MGRVSAQAARGARPSKLIERFVVFEIVCQLALLSPAIGHFRIVARTAAFASSLALLVLVPGRAGRLHPAAKAAVWVIAIVALSLLNPGANSMLAAVAQAAMYLAVLGPLFWMARIRVDMRTVRRVALIIWAFESASAAVGILQVYFPGRFQFALSTAILNQGSYISGLAYINGFGQRVLRPMGLTDTPGSAAAAGFYAALMGLYLFVSARGSWLRAAAAAGAALGALVIYLSMVKAMLVMLTVSAASFIVLLAWRDQRIRKAAAERRLLFKLALTAGLGVAVLMMGYFWAAQIGGRSVAASARMLTAGDFGQLYYSERGKFLDVTVRDLLPEYPMGAGLGRWGMMYAYFGDPANTEHPMIWAEVQWTGWLLDGGVPLVVAYAIAILLALKFAFKAASARTAGALGLFAALVFAFDVGVLAITFDYPFFMSQDAINFWMLNAMLFSVLACSRRKAGGPIRLPQ